MLLLAGTRTSNSPLNERRGYESWGDSRVFRQTWRSAFVPFASLTLLVAILTVGGSIPPFHSGSWVQAQTPPPVECTSSQSATGNVMVTVRDFSFRPSFVQVVIGVDNTVQWTNSGGASHTATSNSGAFDSASLAPGEIYTCTFNQIGTFPYFCAFHASMTATVSVVAPPSTPSGLAGLPHYLV